MTRRAAFVAAARHQVVHAVSLRVHGRDLEAEGHDIEAIAAMLDEALDGRQREWLEDLVQLAGYRAGVEADPVVYGDDVVALMSESEITGMIDDLVDRHFMDPDAPPAAHPSQLPM